MQIRKVIPVQTDPTQAVKEQEQWDYSMHYNAVNARVILAYSKFDGIHPIIEVKVCKHDEAHKMSSISM